MNDYTLYSDEELIALLKKSDAKAFKILYDRYWKLLFFVAAGKLDRLDEAEEIVQEIFTDLWFRRQSLQISRSVKYYLAAAVKYQVMTVLVKRSRQNKLNNLLPENLISANTADQSLHFNQLQKELEAIVCALPERCQTIYRLSREEGYSHKIIAKGLNISEKTVETQITRALSRIRAGLGDAALLLLIFFF